MATKANILLVEDDESLGFVVCDNLKQEGYKVDLGTDGKKGLTLFTKNNYDICLLDVMLPEKDGFSLAEDIRKSNTDIPIVFLTAKSMEKDKIKGFTIGGDDYITKPFSMPELILRIEAILKRTSKKADDTQHFEIGKYSFDHLNQSLTLNNETKILTKKEADLLKLLAENINNVTKREIILTEIWGEDDYFLGRSMDVFITRLRKYLKGDEAIQLINVHGVGFKLEVN